MEEKRMPGELSPMVMIAVTLVAVFLGLQIVGPIIGFLVAMPFYPGTLMEMTNALLDPTSDPNMKMPIFLMQGFGTFIGLIIVPTLLLIRQQKSIVDFFRQPVFIQSVLLIVLIVVVSNIVNSVFAEWNQNVKFPESLSGLEEKLKSLEKELTGMSTYLTQFGSVGQFIMALVVVAVLPGIGEEIVFRGIIQGQLFRSTRNIHVSIWTSAIIFSAFHMQFYGFVPRIFLGALFGYLYFWSNSLTMAVLAHFINNGLIVVVLYLNQRGVLDFDIESNESAPWTAVASATVVTGVLLVVYKKFFESRIPMTPSDSGTDLSASVE